MPLVRLFVAVNLEADLVAAAARTQHALQRSGADVKWVNPDGFHFTLKFLGSVDEARVGEIVEALDGAVSSTEPFEVCLEGVGAFPHPSAPRVVWLGMSEGGTPLAGLAGAVAAAMERLGFAREDRPFSGHLTLGRVRSPRGREALQQALAAEAADMIGRMTVRRVSLMQSRLSPQGATYTELAGAPLAGRAA
jgi:2'-5' RNA ligase